MKTIRIDNTLYDEIKEVASLQKIGMKEILKEAIHEGVASMKEKYVLELYRNNKITLSRAAEMLSVDIWEMIEKVRDSDLHLDYGMEELREDLCL